MNAIRALTNDKPVDDSHIAPQGTEPRGGISQVMLSRLASRVLVYRPGSQQRRY